MCVCVCVCVRACVCLSACTARSVSDRWQPESMRVHGLGNCDFFENVSLVVRLHACVCDVVCCM